MCMVKLWADSWLRACLKIPRGPAARDFGCSQGGEVGASPQRAVTAEPTLAAGKRPAARRVFAEKAGWLRCSSVTAPLRGCSLVAPRHPAFSTKTGLHVIFRQALRPNRCCYVSEFSGNKAYYACLQVVMFAFRDL